MNQYYCDVLPNLRWGIFHEGRLLASVGSQTDAKRMLRYLKSRSSELAHESINDIAHNQFIPGKSKEQPKRRKRLG